MVWSKLRRSEPPGKHKDDAMSSDGQVNEQGVLDALSAVVDPDVHRSVTDLGYVKDVAVRGGSVAFTVQLMSPALLTKDQIADACRAAVSALPGVTDVQVNLTAVVTKRPLSNQDIMPDVKNVVAIASGKGGVGKSTVASNVALALSQAGAAVGLLDADIYGPSVPLMFGVQEQPSVVDQKIVPLERHGLRLMSMGFLASEQTPVIWRGPMVHGAVKQFLSDVLWGALDYLVIDLPPGTGDAQLTLTQNAPLAGAVIVSTPQDVALADARKGLLMFKQVDVPVLGIVENMSFFACPHCGEKTDIFSHGGAERVAGEQGVDFLGAVPIDPQVRVDGDGGTPLVAAHPDCPAAEAFRHIAGAIAAKLVVLNLDQQAFSL